MGGNHHEWGHSKHGISSKPPLPFCPLVTLETARPSLLQSLPGGWCGSKPPIQAPMQPLPPAQEWVSLHGLQAPGWSSWTTFFLPPLEVTTPSQAASNLQRARPGKARERGPFCSPQFWDGGAEARQRVKHFSISPSTSHSSLPNRTVWARYRVVPGSTHFMGLKRACP